MSVQASGSEAAHFLASGCLGNSSTLRRPAAGCPAGQDPGRVEEAEPRRAPQAEPGQDAILPGREALRPLQAALPASLQLLEGREWKCRREGASQAQRATQCLDLEKLLRFSTSVAHHTYPPRAKHLRFTTSWCSIMCYMNHSETSFYFYVNIASAL